MDNPRYILERVVRPNIAEFTDDFSSERHAFNAAAAVDALVAALFFWCAANNPDHVAGIEDDTHFRERLAQENSDYALLRDVAKALKHVELHRGNPQVSRAAQVEARELGWGEGSFGEGPFGGAPHVVITTDEGKARAMSSVIASAMNFIEDEMAEAGC